MKSPKKKPARKSTKSKSTGAASVKKRVTSKATSATRGSKLSKAKVKSSENVSLTQIQKENQRLSRQLKQRERELEIEAALEEIRSRSLAMHKSDELQEVVNTLFERLVGLGIKADSSNIAIFKEGTRDFDYWIASPVQDHRAVFHIPYIDYGITKDMMNAKESSADFFSKCYPFVEKNRWFDYGFRYTDFKFLNEERKKFILDAESVTVSIAFAKHTGVQINRYCTDSSSEDEIDLLKTFAKVFEQAYIRFLDLQQAEAQTREAQIQLALEKVRARTMAMQRSDELSEVAVLLFQQVKSFGLASWGCGFNIWEKDEKVCTSYFTDPAGNLVVPFKIPLTEDPIFIRFYESRQKGDDFWTEEISGEQEVEHYKYLCSLPVLGDMLKATLASGISFPTLQIDHGVNFSRGNLLFITYEPVPEAHDIFKRFGKVFEQTYTRFLDLKKAEAQAREAQIETALERIRAKALAMQSSKDLIDVANALREQMGRLGQPDLESSIVHLYNGDSASFDAWYAYRPPNQAAGETIKGSASVVKDCSEWSREIIACYKSGAEEYTVTASGAKIKEWYKMLEGLAPATLDYDQSGHLIVPEILYYHFSKFSGGALLTISNQEPSAETRELQKRAATVFDLAYTRFLDLQRAEAQAKEAKIETALERVRSRSMAMHRSEELSAVISVVSEQLQHLGFRFDNASFVINSESEDYDFWFSIPGMPQPHQIHVPYLKNPINDRAKDARAKGLKFQADIISPDDSRAWHQHMFDNNRMDFLSDEAKAIVLKGGYARSVAFMPNIMLVIGNYASKPYSEEQNVILRRFATAFEQTYTRFLDLKKAEEQARDAQIEAALEKVRSRSLAMHRSDELREIVKTVFDKLEELNFVLEDGAVTIAIFEDHSRNHTQWIADPGHSYATPFKLPYTDHSIPADLFAAKESGADYFAKIYPTEEKNDYFRHLFDHSSYKHLPDEIKEMILGSTQYGFSIAFAKNSAIVVPTNSGRLLNESEKEILKRFVRVFEQAYTRFLDLQKAEGQARESQIEAGLERVRSSAMAMRSSDELTIIIGKVFTECTRLDMRLDRGMITIIDPETRDIRWWFASPEVADLPRAYLTRHHPHAPYQAHLMAWKEQVVKWTYLLEGKEKEDWDKFLFHDTELALLPAEVKDGMMGFKRIYINGSFNNFGCLALSSAEPMTDDAFDIVLRFAKVFDLTYTRFNDLRQAEAQAREAQIEAALERVRAKTMAMHQSDELIEVINSVFDQMRKLNFVMDGALLHIFDEHAKEFQLWIGDAQNSFVQKVNFTIFDHPIIANYLGSRKEPGSLSHHVYSREEKDRYFKFEFEHSELRNLPLERREYMLSKPGYACSMAWMKHGVLAIDNFDAREFSEEENGILLRFAKVFEQTYTRFLDLQKAEAQAREATIEASLERVRAKAMAMHSTADLTTTISTIFTELRNLGIKPLRFGLGILQRTSRYASLYSASVSDDGGDLQLVGSVILEGHPVLTTIYDRWHDKEDTYFPVLKGESLKSYYEKLRVNFQMPDSKTDEQYGQFYYFEEGALYSWSENPVQPAEVPIFKRFTSVLALTYKRYYELQQSENNAREAVRRASLDRVRAEIASMRTATDLERITPLIWKELTILGIPFVRCGVFIMDEENQRIHTFLSTPEGKAIAALHLPYDSPSRVKEILIHWKRKESYIEHWDESAFAELADQLLEQGILASKEQYMSTVPPEGVHLHCLPFPQGMFYVGNKTVFVEDDIHLIRLLADAFSSAYARYEDFNKLESAKQQVDKTLVDLKQTQQQLVQSEKMASLGELTAGIAHEIQNPLNFVNNFSDVSNELLQEMTDEITKGNIEAARTIARDVKQNLEKILHHGKRADGIVKGMLQHSRSSSGVKEPTNINVLADEYLRLAYHGLRAKDKFFDATLKTDFDPGIGNINVVPQEFGRVILNLITNAFYAVSEKKKQQEGFEPVITVITKKAEDGIRISVRDNGLGIPHRVLEKIFQPFFTTKPAGQGTGLGLSLSYDIVKAHGGELKVETKEGEGTEFIIELFV